jgi:hypothetical protein
MKYSQKQIENIEIKGGKVKALSIQAGFQSEYGLRVKNSGGFQEFISWLYGEPFNYISPSELSKEDIKDAFDEL